MIDFVPNITLVSKAAYRIALKLLDEKKKKLAELREKG